MDGWIDRKTERETERERDKYIDALRCVDGDESVLIIAKEMKPRQTSTPTHRLMNYAHIQIYTHTDRYDTHMDVVVTDHSMYTQTKKQLVLPA